MALCTGVNFTPNEYPPGFKPTTIEGYLNMAYDCVWFDDALRAEQSGNESVWLELMPKIWRHILPDSMFNSSLVHCYDIAVANALDPDAFKYRSAAGPKDYVKIADQCCRKSSFAAGDQDIGGIGVSVHILVKLAPSDSGHRNADLNCAGI